MMERYRQDQTKTCSLLDRITSKDGKVRWWPYKLVWNTTNVCLCQLAGAKPVREFKDSHPDTSMHTKVYPIIILFDEKCYFGGQWDLLIYRGLLCKTGPSQILWFCKLTAILNAWYPFISKSMLLFHHLSHSMNDAHSFSVNADSMAVAVVRKCYVRSTDIVDKTIAIIHRKCLKDTHWVQKSH